MADFYVNYGSKGAKLLGLYRCGKINISLHDVNGLYVVSKNRRVLTKQRDFENVYSYFRNVIFLECPESLFNIQNF